ncbi:MULTISPECIES: bifunctional 3-(3-hydroxy-phenyl)propionate/3-hydroxycinnamic acid hydroxylase [Actinomadura]|uniref:Bifunctional 3-(3-hydroxy-phenyl)propionate/3-hydroxycinnamic acid hydroxylase n=1 Tax=Actinomadura yumaensis TaxID=111807 RepID=A0ABW2CIP9_9ACTN|nr:bifunctional 3-(3-hydroxy-phenyl)propionate/3-hydroxycinnamic acid hydroxylase [Actinomadura sp. J1-007]MWK37094.1 bifunctional 3-(3-hydroxy-phenyl)propionate/3-hydroxycinnamic acid hydroxylase [Actinomadura sp. J1-007]
MSETTDPAGRPGDDVLYDVVLIGYGPVGQTLAALLGQAGREVAVFERWPRLYGRARAGHVDHEIMRIFQSLGIAERVERDMFRATKYVFRNADGETLLTFDWDADGISGWPSDYIMYQPSIEDALDAAVRAQPTVSVHQGWEATAIAPHEDHVEITLRESTESRSGESASGARTRTVRARYLVGADGANSFVRTRLGASQTDFGFRETWFVCDLEPNVPLDLGFDNGQVCDPARPHCLFQLGARHRRFEFALLPGEDPGRFRDPRAAWELLAPYGVTPGKADLVRHAVYTFEAKLADRWRRGRILLAGDAAHVMPPFMGQGMCSGIRDAKALAWRLDLVLRGLAADAVLDGYQAERAPHVETLIRMSVEAGRVSCTFDPEIAAARDEAFRRGEVAPPPPFPHLLDGLLDTGAGGRAAEVVGRLAPQGRVRSGGRTGRFDDVVGHGWTLLLAPGADCDLTPGQAAVLDRLGARIVALGEDPADIDGYYAGYFARTGLSMILYRPDFYVFGAAEDGAAAGRVVDALGRSIGGPSQIPAVP